MSRRWLADASGSVADIGVLAPIAAALILRNGLDAGTVLVGVGALYVGAGVFFRVPVPVQPVKAAAAIAIARELPPETISATAMLLGAVLVLLAATGAASVLARVFVAPIVRGLQLGVGLILLRTALSIAADAGAAGVVAAVVVGAVLVVAALGPRPVLLALPLLAAGVLAGAAFGGPLGPMQLELWSPHLAGSSFDPQVLLSALVLLVVPQVPLTFGNAVVGLVHLERLYFPHDAGRVTPASVATSSGVANVLSGVVSGMPMCHGSGGLTAHYRAGARTFRMNVVIGGSLLGLGLFCGPAAVALLAAIPVGVLAGLLAFTGAFHAWLAASSRGFDAIVAVAMGILGLLTTNLAVALAAGVALHWGRAWLRSLRIAARSPAP